MDWRAFFVGGIAMLKCVAAATVLALALGGGSARSEEALVSFKVLSPAVALELLFHVIPERPGLRAHTSRLFAGGLRRNWS